MHDVKLELDKKTYLCTRFNDFSVPKMLKNRDHKSNSQRVDIQSGVNIVFQSAPDSNRLFELEVKPQNAAASEVSDLTFGSRQIQQSDGHTWPSCVIWQRCVNLR